MGSLVDSFGVTHKLPHSVVMTTDEHPPLHRLLPQPFEPVTVASAYAMPRVPLTDRPWISLSMVTSVDGSVSVDGASGALGNPNDLDVLLTLRRLSDVVIVGAGTVRGEGYGPPKQRDKRIGVVTNSGNVDLDSDLFTSGAGFVITNDSADVDEDRVDVVRAGADELDITLAVTRLHTVVPGVRWVQAEGGPGFNGSLIDADIVDEIDVNFSPHIVGGDGPRLITGAGELLRDYQLDQLLADDDGFLFARYLRRRTAD